ncbi:MULTISPECIES: hypothetical protein [unclassified Paraburkholderia]|uniref:hypothetical protein n=1 Tax=unclassified Paraburkholderia TaxID=2615204 RepID=UPI00161205B3|nr:MULTISPECIES: hypothetical protein [unclassified Paraburkholderia]MBB5444508.1 hypothetical protein [Paraburkholderia sp. WSM4177]MBB5485333.1 hypothetical protein [Paraburkholderia sp. WSM4180]
MKLQKIKAGKLLQMMGSGQTRPIEQAGSGLSVEALRTLALTNKSSHGRAYQLAAETPELVIRMLIVGYCFGVRSKRRLCEDL